MNKFITNLVATDKTIKQKRAEGISKEAELAQKALVNDLELDVNQLESTLGKLEDLHPTNTTSLQVGGGNFNAKTWVASVQKTKVDLANKSVELEIAKATYDEWFKS